MCYGCMQALDHRIHIFRAMSVGYRSLGTLVEGNYSIPTLFLCDATLRIKPILSTDSVFESNPYVCFQKQKLQNTIWLYSNHTMPIEAISGHLELLGECFREEHETEFEDIPLPGPSQFTIIEYLISQNPDIWQKFLDNRFCRVGYTGSDPKFNDKWLYYAKVQPSLSYPFHPSLPLMCTHHISTTYSKTTSTSWTMCASRPTGDSNVRTQSAMPPA